jgi:hypothetical protein
LEALDFLQAFSLSAKRNKEKTAKNPAMARTGADFG